MSTLRRLACAALVLTCLPVAAVADEFTAPCGSVPVPEVDGHGALCLAVCGNGFGSASCAVSDVEHPQAEPSAEPRLYGPASFLRIRILGNEVTLGLLADRLRSVTGWKVDLDNGFDKLELAPGEWGGSWEELSELNLKIRNAGHVSLAGSVEAHTFTFKLHDS